DRTTQIQQRAIPLQPGTVVINEVLYDPPQSGPDAPYEWLELTNTTAYTLSLAGWTIGDSSATDPLPVESIPPGSFLVIAASPEFFANFPDHAGPIAFLADGTIGNGLANDGDRLILRDDQGTIIDALSYGDDTSVFDPPCPDVAPGHSLERSPAGHDTDRADDFVDQAAPSPGQPIPPATPTPQPSPTPTPIPVVPLFISEVLYDGTIPSTEGDEFVELRNPTDQTVALDGYKVGDEEERGKGEGMVRFPGGAAIGPGSLVVVAKNAAQFQARFGALPDFEVVVSGGGYTDTLAVPNMVPYDPWASGQWALSNSGDEVLLLGPNDEILDAVAFRDGDYAAAGVTGVLSAPEPRSLQRVGLDDTDDMRADFAMDLPNPGAPTDLPSPPPPPPAPALPGGMRAYFGCLQAHSTYSDGSGPPRYAYAVGRANGLHFLALTDHSHWFGPEEWADLEDQARDATVDGAFVALRGFEWTHKTAGHIGVLGTEGFASRDDPAYDSLAEFYAWLADQEGAIGQFHHPFADSDFDDFAYDPAADERIVLLEVGNGSGALYRTFEGAYLQALAVGWHVGAANNGDTETADWG
ncbi:MAG TPA: hypothetical protein EYP55_07310, partial [Anaerolineae bacterium]|nr:hypothetical protein [Anaerolineae bacterium]